MREAGLGDVGFVLIDTDYQALRRTACSEKIVLGENTKPRPFCTVTQEWARQAALDDREQIRKAIDGCGGVIIIAGLGGGTAGGAAPVVAETAREAGARVIAVVTQPLICEGQMRKRQAEDCLERLENVTDTFVIPLQGLITAENKNMTLADVYKKAGDVVYQAVWVVLQGLTGERKWTSKS